MVDRTRVHMRADEFLSLPETTQITELLDGEVIVSPSPTISHQLTVLSIAAWLQRTAPNGVVLIAPMDVWFDDIDVAQPDVFWVSDQNERCYQVENKHWHGPPDLTVEVLSPSNAQNDYRTKYDLYERHGVREYWIVHPLAHTVQVFINTDGVFVHQGSFEVGETFASPVLNGDAVEVKTLLGSR